MKILLGFLLAPLAPLLVIAPLVVLVFRSLDAVGPFAFACVVYGDPATFISGTSLYLLFRDKGWLGWKHVTVGGLILGASIPAVIGLLIGVASGSPGVGVAFLAVAPFGAVLGSLTAFAFWFIAFRGRPVPPPKVPVTPEAPHLR